MSSGDARVDKRVRSRDDLVMNAEAALEMQIELYRKMTGQQRLQIALELHETSCEVARAGIRRQFPGASADEVEEKLRARIALARGDD